MREDAPLSTLGPGAVDPRPRDHHACWQSLEELAQTPDFLARLTREFPEEAAVLEDPRSRREFLKLMGASLFLGGLAGCTRQPPETIVPYARQPEEVVPGRPLFFATAVAPDGYARGVLVESHEGRPTKVEGNPEHPESLGAADIFGQAHVLGLYDPDRSRTVTYYGEVRTPAAFREALRSGLEARRAGRGEGLRFLTGTVTSPALSAQLAAILREFPSARWHAYEPIGRDHARAGALLAFGEDVEAQYRFSRAEVILSLEADFAGGGHPAGLRLIREFAARRRVEDEGAAMSRLYVVESTPSLTGAIADHRLGLRASEVEGLARDVAAELGVAVERGGSAHAAWARVVARDLKARAGAALVIAGETQPPAVHALAHAMNAALGAAGRTVVYTPPVEARPGSHADSLRELAADMEAGKVEMLVVLGANPAYAAPADLRFAERLDRVPLRIHLGLYADETAERCHWHVPEAHPLEAWSDARAVDGTVTIIQPLIAPLYGGLSAHEFLAAFSNRQDRSGHDIVRDHWREQLGAAGFEERWRRMLHDGVAAGTAVPERAVSLKPLALGPAPRAGEAGLELIFRADPTVGDGRFANNAWLQELPKPLTKLTWDNAALIGPGTAQRLGFTIRETAAGHFTDVAEIRYRGRSVRAPVWVLPGHPEGAVTVHLGYGRTRAGRVGTGAGFSAYALRSSDAPWFGAGAELVRTGDTARLACTQDHWSIGQKPHAAARARHLVRAATLAEYRADPGVFARMGVEPGPESSLYAEHEYKGHAWGMSIDLNACVGCNACVTACQAENNIPVVGKDQVARGREMHWIRIDRYYQGPPEDPRTFHQPVTCMHCENAPCEVVCPVAATVHSDEGLNDMVYNRCVGTRYCSNNCPYKVRRFNFFLYQDWTEPAYKMLRNPDVTVRSRGVMEKCTYCVQRINRARIDARNEGRLIRDGDIQTACQAACPAQAIVFGDINDARSRVAKLKASPRDYGLLAELQTRPRTSYLAAVRNPNPELPAAGAAAGGG